MHRFATSSATLSSSFYSLVCLCHFSSSLVSVQSLNLVLSLNDDDVLCLSVVGVFWWCTCKSWQARHCKIASSAFLRAGGRRQLYQVRDVLESSNTHIKIGRPPCGRQALYQVRDVCHLNVHRCCDHPTNESCNILGGSTEIWTENIIRWNF